MQKVAALTQWLKWTESKRRGRVKKVRKTYEEDDLEIPTSYQGRRKY
jgi:hypothetical protein